MPYLYLVHFNVFFCTCLIYSAIFSVTNCDTLNELLGVVGIHFYDINHSPFRTAKQIFGTANWPFILEQALIIFENESHLR